MMREEVLKYLYEINARCDIKLEEVADEITCMFAQTIMQYSMGCSENGQYREAECLEFVANDM